MAAKTSSKTAARKSAAHKSAARNSSARKSSPSKSTATKSGIKKIEARPHPAAPKPEPPAPPKPAAPRRVVESVSLIDKQPASKRTGDGDVKKKATALPPISRIRESLSVSTPPPAPPKPVAPPPPPPPAPPADEAPIVTGDAASAETEATPAEVEDNRKVIHIKPPIIVKQLSADLGIKPHQLIAELMNYNIFANVNQTVEPDIATKIAEAHGFILEKERREKGGDKRDDKK